LASHDGVPSTQLAPRISIPNVCSPVDPTTKKIGVMPSLNLHVERVFVDLPFNYSSTWRRIVDERANVPRGATYQFSVPAYLGSAS
jgi:hypothetical protein